MAATYAVELPNDVLKGMPAPVGTGFFISPDGWFVTAAHVVTQNGRSDGPARDDVGEACLMKEPRHECPVGAMCQSLRLEYIDPETDFALLKVDLEANRNKGWMKGKSAFPYIEVSERSLEEGESVYAFGYPLSNSRIIHEDQWMVMAHSSLFPRTTSAIVSSLLEGTTPVWTMPFIPEVYVLDKALNYGNSGGPIVATETGKGLRGQIP